MDNSNVSSKDIRNTQAPITCLTCYDYLTAKVMDQVQDLDMILVGDSLGMVMLGHDRTLSVTVDDMIHHTKAVSKGVNRAFLVSDIPFMEMAKSRDSLVDTVRRVIRDGGAQAVKIEGGKQNVESIEHLVNHDIPVVGHIGLTPQSIEAFGDYEVQGTTEDEIKKLGRDAELLDEAGVLAIVLECVPARVAEGITEMVDCKTIGIGAGPDCDGQVLVWQDMMGLSDDETPSFVRQWGHWEEDLTDGVKEFCDSVRQRSFPNSDESFSTPDDVNDRDITEWLKNS